MHRASGTHPGQRIAALAGTLLVHAALLLALFAESAIVPPPHDRPLIVRIIDATHGRAAGAPTARAEARAPSSAKQPVAAPRRAPIVAAHATGRVTRTSEAIARVVVESRIPPPAIDRSSLRVSVGASATSLAIDPGPAAGAAGSGRAGEDATGGMRRIAFARRVAPLLLASARRHADGSWAIVAVRVDAGGRAREVRMVRSTGSPDLDYALREAARESRYVPHVQGGRPVTFWGLVPYVFGEVDADVEGALAAAGISHT
jgi:TonB family protein